MQRICSVAAAMVGLSLTLGVAPSWAQRPPTNDTSDNMGNTAGGTGALTSSTPGNFNTAYGNAALRTNTGNSNTAVGTIALSFSGTGNNNTAVGNAALEVNRAGNNNTAIGNLALNSITSTDNNTAIGASALTNSTGSDNSAVGLLALGKSTTGSGNTAIGENALGDNSTGSNNIAIGLDAGSKLASGSDNIYLGAESAVSESRIMRLGQDQTHTFVAGIAGHPLVGSQVVVTAAGQLGIVASSARFKRDIQAMGERSQGLLQLRPVTFRYKQEPARNPAIWADRRGSGQSLSGAGHIGARWEGRVGAVPRAHSDVAQRVAAAAAGVPGAEGRLDGALDAAGGGCPPVRLVG